MAERRLREAMEVHFDAVASLTAWIRQTRRVRWRLGNVTLGTEHPSYTELFLQLQPRPIRTEEEANAIQQQIDTLIDKGDLSEDERDFLNLLGNLMLAWEDGRYLWPDVPPHEIARALVEDNGLRQKDLVGRVFPTESIASEVLAGKRRLTYDYVRKLAVFFHVSPAIFYPLDEQED